MWFMLAPRGGRHAGPETKPGWRIFRIREPSESQPKKTRPPCWPARLPQESACIRAMLIPREGRWCRRPKSEPPGRREAQAGIQYCEARRTASSGHRGPIVGGCSGCEGGTSPADTCRSLRAVFPSGLRRDAPSQDEAPRSRTPGPTPVFYAKPTRARIMLPIPIPWRRADASPVSLNHFPHRGSADDRFPAGGAIPPRSPYVRYRCRVPDESRRMRAAERSWAPNVINHVGDASRRRPRKSRDSVNDHRDDGRRRWPTGTGQSVVMAC